MKTVILALLVLLAVSQNEALRCNCTGSRSCFKGVETCSGSNKVCAGIITYFGPIPSYMKGCMTMRECARLHLVGISTAKCCRTDRCN